MIISKAAKTCIIIGICAGCAFYLFGPVGLAGVALVMLLRMKTAD